MKEKNFLYQSLKFLLGWYFRWYYQIEFVNNDFIPKEGRIIIACNHKGSFDPCLMILSTKRIIHFLAKDKHYDKWFLKPLFKHANCIRVNTKYKDGLSLKNAIEVLNNEQVIGIYPEGTRNKTDQLLPFKYGTVKMAEKTKAYIVPCAIIGTYHFHSHIKIVFDQPYQVQSHDLDAENDKLYHKIKKLINENGGNK